MPTFEEWYAAYLLRDKPNSTWDKMHDAWNASRTQALNKARKYAIHRTRCKAFPAHDEEQIIKDCDCGLSVLFGEKK